VGDHLPHPRPHLEVMEEGEEEVNNGLLGHIMAAAAAVAAAAILEVPDLFRPHLGQMPHLGPHPECHPIGLHPLDGNHRPT
jgi:hypothetical protein